MPFICFSFKQSLRMNSDQMKNDTKMIKSDIGLKGGKKGAKRQKLLFLIAMQQFQYKLYKGQRLQLQIAFYCKFNIFLIKIIEMSIKRTEFTETKEGLCRGCMLFYGSQAYQGLCSSCHKKNQTQKKEEIVTKQVELERGSVAPCRKDTTDTVEEINQQPAQKDRKRCFNCSKKVGLLGIECKCGFVYCNSHRLPEYHDCVYNHAADGKKKLQKQVIKVYNGKIAEI